jgi:hypothetical protein
LPSQLSIGAAYDFYLDESKAPAAEGAAEKEECQNID